MSSFKIALNSQEKYIQYYTTVFFEHLTIKQVLLEDVLYCQFISSYSMIVGGQSSELF